MPRQTNSRSTTRTTPATTTRGRKPNGGTTTTRNGGRNSKPQPNGAWPVELVLAAEVELAIEGKDGDAFGFAICTMCAALLPGSEVSRALHARFHELVDGIDQRAG
jgi:hypothetical protein